MLLAAITTAFVAAAMAAPAAAVSKGRIVIVNGQPFKNMEVCINNNEVKRGLKYGKSAVRWANPGTKVVKFRKNSPGTCKGRLIAQKTFTLGAADDRTIVVTKLTPMRVVLFPTTPIGDEVFRHASDIGTAGFKYLNPATGTPWYPAADEPYEKGMWGWGGGHNGWLFWAHQPPSQDPVAGPFTMDKPDGKRRESVLVGSNLSNARFVHVIVSQRPP